MQQAVPIALTVAGSDPSGGAGLQADLKTFHAHDVYGAAVISLITVQNTRSVSRVHVLDAELVREQLLAVLDDLDVRALKTGALGSREVVAIVSRTLSGRGIPLVVDPVMISKHGHALLDEPASGALAEQLLPLATLVTPNLPEAGALAGMAVEHLDDARRAAARIVALGARSVLVKGGHLPGDVCVDVLLHEGRFREFSSPRVVTTAGHGTGCTLSAAITARLARGEPLEAAVEGAKAFVDAGLRLAPAVGHGIGPLEHRQRPV